ncbi:cell adhesion molecule DSCAM-like, partial [Littorina saxatilis]|uniref:cell adhesion molecule DSCAM-like n=1 Tax=Littorina saxatilis TaxID=31220 RepID=UPI0038B43CD1
MIQLANGTLRIIKALENDHGFYLCHASNGIGIGISKVVRLVVHIPARFNEPKRNYTVLKNHNVTMECQAVGDKPLSVSWSFNGMPVSTSHPRAQVVTQNTPRGALSQLTLRPAMRNDTGLYTCNAKNKFGHGTLVSNLIVNEPPEAATNLEVVNVGSRSVTLRWIKPFDGNSPLLSYTLQYKNETDVWQGVLANVTVPAVQPQATVPGLFPAFTYHIRVIANNSIGVSPASEVVTATTLEEAPSGPPPDVSVKAIGSQALQVTWQAPSKGIRNGHIMGYYIGYRETQSSAQFLYITKTTEPVDEEDVILMHTIHNLKKFTEYTVHVKAYNSKGISPPSEDTMVFTLEDVPSQPPKNVQATPLSSRSIRVAWSPPPLYTLHGILQGYKVLYKPVRLDEDESDANFVTSSRLEVILYNLQRYTNYSIQVLAYTRKGEGVRSEPIYIITQQDAPESPAAIKALPVNVSSILVAWQPPKNPNGILTHYTLYYRNSSVPVTQEQSSILPAEVLYVRLPGLRENVEYSFRVTASTVMGEGESTPTVAATPKREVAARIASFPDILTVPWHKDVTLQCMAVGWPLPTIQWSLRGQPIRAERGRYSILDNGSLSIKGVAGSDAANYTCTASNAVGENHISYMLRVQVGDHTGTVPQPPRLNLVLTTTTTIQVNWLSGSNGGSHIQGFVLSYRKDHNSWKSVRLGPTNRTYIAAGLMCGTQYRFTVHAFNRLGDSPDSKIIEAKTNGSVPIMPPQSMLLKEINVTTVTLDLTSWLTYGCPIRFFSVRHRLWGDTDWHLVNNHVPPNITHLLVPDLHPATWYVMIVTAHSDAGSTDSELKFATLTYTG